MKIVATCPSCGRRYDVPERLAGKKVQCKDCPARFRVPVPSTLPRRRRKTSRRDSDILSAPDLLEGILEPESLAAPR